jgi:hypothetical protein
MFRFPRHAGSFSFCKVVQAVNRLLKGGEPWLDTEIFQLHVASPHRGHIITSFPEQLTMIIKDTFAGKSHPGYASAIAGKYCELGQPLGIIFPGPVPDRQPTHADVDNFGQSCYVWRIIRRKSNAQPPFRLKSLLPSVHLLLLPPQDASVYPETQNENSTHREVSVRICCPREKGFFVLARKSRACPARTGKDPFRAETSQERLPCIYIHKFFHKPASRVVDEVKLTHY